MVRFFVASTYSGRQGMPRESGGVADHARSTCPTSRLTTCAAPLTSENVDRSTAHHAVVASLYSTRRDEENDVRETATSLATGRECCKSNACFGAPKRHPTHQCSPGVLYFKRSFFELAPISVYKKSAAATIVQEYNGLVVHLIMS
jgi:hypothetical protein